MREKGKLSFIAQFQLFKHCFNMIVPDSNIVNDSMVWKDWGGFRWETHTSAGGKTFCFLPAQTKWSNRHSLTMCSEGSGLDSSAWKATFHPISSQCWVLGVFIVPQLCNSPTLYRGYMPLSNGLEYHFCVQSVVYSVQDGFIYILIYICVFCMHY